MYGLTFAPGSWPPSPGLAPCATLISICSADIRYAGVTPKRPEATCLILERAMSPFLRPFRCAKSSDLPVSSSTSTISSQRTESSPPSPEFERAPARLTPMASVSCASRESAPSDMPPVAKRFMIDSTDSTSEMSMGSRSDLISSMSRMTVTGAFSTFSL